MCELRLTIAENMGQPSDEESQAELRSLYKNAMKEAKEGLAIARHLGIKDSRGTIQANLNCSVAMVCGIMGLYREGLKNAEEAKIICQQNGDTFSLVGCLLTAAQVHRYNDNRKEGKSIAERALTLAQSLGDEDLERTARQVLESMERKKAPEPVAQMPGQPMPQGGAMANSMAI